MIGRAARLALVMGCLAGSSARAQVTSTVDPLDPAYLWIDALRAEGLVPTAPAGQRPYSRAEFARLAAAARTRLAADSARATLPHVERILRRLETKFAPERENRALGRIAAEAVQLDGEYRDVTNGNLGYIDARTNPLAEHRQGRQTATALNIHLESDHWGRLGRHVALAARPSLWLASTRAPSGDRQEAALRQAYLIAGVGTLRLQAGRDFAVLGHGMNGGLAISNNAPAFDMIRVGTDAPFRLPWILGLAGPIGFTGFIADLGPRQNFPHARLAAGRGSISPVAGLELGVVVLQHVGGKGSPPASFRHKIADFVPLIDAIFLGSRDLQFSNKLSGADARVVLPGAVQLYGELLFDDFDLRRVRSTFVEDAGVLVGVSVARLPGADALRLEAEAHHMGLRMYQHSQYVSGITRDEWILGNPLGARAKAGYLRLTHGNLTERTLKLDLAYEWRSDDQYHVLVDDARDNGWRFLRDEVRPRETRLRGVVEWMAFVDGGTRVIVTAGGERVRNFGFHEGRHRLHLLGRIGFDRDF